MNISWNLTHDVIFYLMLTEAECDLDPCQGLADRDRGPQHTVTGPSLEGVSTLSTLIFSLFTA